MVPLSFLQKPLVATVNKKTNEADFGFVGPVGYCFQFTSESCVHIHVEIREHMENKFW